MGKFLKYELKGNCKLLSGLIAVAVLLYTIVLLKINDSNTPIMIALFSTVTFGLFIMTLVFVVNSFKNELYEDRGYLTFTLPLSGRKILLAKLLGGIIWFIVAGIIVSIFSLLLMASSIPGFLHELSQLNSYVNVKAVLMISVLFAIICVMVLLLLIYFSITITKVAVRKKKISGFLGLLVFIVLNFIILYIGYRVMNLFPQTVNIDLNFLLGAKAKYDLVSTDGQGFGINIALIIYDILVCIAIFLSTAYLMDNKIDI